MTDPRSAQHIPAMANALGITDEAETPTRRAQLTWTDKIEMQATEWTWREDNEPGRLPAAGITIAAGREGTGKSTFATWIAARITKGTLPGACHGAERNVFYIAVEDSWSRTIAPRLKAAGADLAKIARFEVVPDIGGHVALSLSANIDLLADQIQEHDGPWSCSTRSSAQCQGRSTPTGSPRFTAH